MILNHRMVRFALVPLAAFVLLTALVFLAADPPTPVAAAGTPDWQQTRGNMPVTGTMPMTNAMPAMMPQPSMGARMEMMGHMMQMMGMMMQMRGMMGEMVEAGMPMTGMMSMNSGTQMDMMDMAPMMQMMEQMMGQMPMTTTAPVSDTTGATQPAQTQTVQAGAVEIKVTATNLQDTNADTIDFAIELNSHSVELDLDLAETARLLVGDNEMTSTAWETASPKGHHVTGVLRFARTTETGGTSLDEATEISLVISGLPGDVERAFTWEVNPQ